MLVTLAVSSHQVVNTDHSRLMWTDGGQNLHMGRRCGLSCKLVA